MEDEGREFSPNGGVTRRDLVKRGAVVGGALLWATPIVQSIGPSALAQQRAESQCGCCYCYNGDKATAVDANDQCLANGFHFAESCEETCTNAGFENFEECKGAPGDCNCVQGTSATPNPPNKGCNCPDPAA